jgi:hypothetical protein
MLNTRRITATPRVRYLTRTTSPNPRSWSQHRKTLPLRSATMAMIW